MADRGSRDQRMRTAGTAALRSRVGSLSRKKSDVKLPISAGLQVSVRFRGARVFILVYGTDRRGIPMGDDNRRCLFLHIRDRDLPITAYASPLHPPALRR